MVDLVDILKQIVTGERTEHCQLHKRSVARKLPYLADLCAIRMQCCYYVFAKDVYLGRGSPRFSDCFQCISYCDEWLLLVWSIDSDSVVEQILMISMTRATPRRRQC